MTDSRYLALCYIINNKDSEFLLKYGPDYYQDYNLTKTGTIIALDGYLPEYNAILNHYRKYNTIPTVLEITTALSEDSILRHNGVVATSSPAEYYATRLCEEYTHTQSALVINSSIKGFTTDAIKASRNLQNKLSSINTKISSQSVNTSFSSRKSIIKSKFAECKANPQSVYSTGLSQLDNILDDGFRSNEELVVILAQTNIGKTWWSLKFALECWRQGLRVGYFSPEMSEQVIWNRLLTLNAHVSNKGLNKPYDSDLDDTDLDELLNALPSKGDMHIATMSYFNDSVTVDKLEHWIVTNKLQALFIDGLSYIIVDNENKYASWERPGVITRELMALSVKLDIPIIVTVQANRGAKGTSDDDLYVPTLDTVSNSYQIVQHATRVIGIGRSETEKDLYGVSVLKNRYGDNNTQVKYRLDLNTGKFLPDHDHWNATEFNYIPTFYHGCKITSPIII